MNGSVLPAATLFLTTQKKKKSMLKVLQNKRKHTADCVVHACVYVCMYLCMHCVTQWLRVLLRSWRFMSRAIRKFHSGNLITLNYCSGLWLMLLAESMLVNRTCSVTHLNQVTVVLLSLKQQPQQKSAWQNSQGKF